jgi:hypothetical protein
VKYASLKVLVLVLATGSLIAACASGNDTTDLGAGGASGTSTSSSPSDTSTTSVGSGGGGTGGGTSLPDGGSTCIPKCNADSDCQNSCPAAQTGSNCCDAATGLCYVASTSICPMPKPDGGTMMPPY